MKQLDIAIYTAMVLCIVGYIIWFYAQDDSNSRKELLSKSSADNSLTGGLNSLTGGLKLLKEPPLEERSLTGGVPAGNLTPFPKEIGFIPSIELNVASHRPRPHHPPVDLVYLWVDGSDAVWREKRDKEAEKDVSLITPKEASRSRNNNELLYSLRSVYKYLKKSDSDENLWIRKIFIVVDHQRPAWLKDSLTSGVNSERESIPLRAGSIPLQTESISFENNPQIVIVEQDDLFPNKADLPVFNSQAIECWLHRIPDLSERYIYINDDMMFGAPVRYEDMFDDRDEPIRMVQKHRPILNTASPFMNSVSRAITLIQKHFNSTPPPPSHFPRAFRKSTVSLCYQTFPGAFNTTSKSKFRDYTDTCIVFLLEFFDYEYRKQQNLSPSIEIGDGGFVSVGDNIQANIVQCVNAMYAPPHKFLCFNDDSPTGNGFAPVVQMWAKFLPDPSPWEKIS